jgi:hypothetical protein
MRKNEHPRCGCRSCKRGASSAYGKFIHRHINRAIRHQTKQQLALKGDDFDMVILSTPYTD